MGILQITMGKTAFVQEAAQRDHEILRTLLDQEARIDIKDKIDVTL